MANRRLWAALILLSFGASRAMAGGFSCHQQVGPAGLMQASCGSSSAGAGFCSCASGAVPWGEVTYGTWCRAGGTPQPGCGVAVPAEDQAGRAVPPPAAEIVDGGAMGAALQQGNPYVALLVSALRDGQRWVDGPAEGLVHDSYYDGTSGSLAHSAALHWIGLVTKGGLNAVRLDVTVTDDLRKLARLKQVADSAFPAAVVPGAIHGVVTDGALHGSLLAISPDGKSQTIQW